MRVALTVLLALVALEHLWFLVLEMFLFRTQTGLETFQMSQAVADACGTMAMNQGLYNGFLAAGALTALVTRSPLMRRFILGCVVAAGVFGAVTLGSFALFLVQGLPAAVALVLGELHDRRASAGPASM
jgi:putative membrane protein